MALADAGGMDGAVTAAYAIAFDDRSALDRSPFDITARSFRVVRACAAGREIHLGLGERRHADQQGDGTEKFFHGE